MRLDAHWTLTQAPACPAALDSHQATGWYSTEMTDQFRVLSASTFFTTPALSGLSFSAATTRLASPALTHASDSSPSPDSASSTNESGRRLASCRLSPQSSVSSSRTCDSRLHSGRSLLCVLHVCTPSTVPRPEVHHVPCASVPRVHCFRWLCLRLTCVSSLTCIAFHDSCRSRHTYSTQPDSGPSTTTTPGYPGLLKPPRESSRAHETMFLRLRGFCLKQWHVETPGHGNLSQRRLAVRSKAFVQRKLVNIFRTISGMTRAREVFCAITQPRLSLGLPLW